MIRRSLSVRFGQRQHPVGGEPLRCPGDQRVLEAWVGGLQRPSQLRGDQRVDIQRPRSLVNVRSAPGYGELSSHLWQELFEEVSGAYGRYQI